VRFQPTNFRISCGVPYSVLAVAVFFDYKPGGNAVVLSRRQQRASSGAIITITPDEPRHSRRMTRSCLDRVTHQEGLGIGPQPLAISGVIIPAEGGLLGQVL
jgi:hypothetical protein